jgi:hypothetical protein
MNTYRSLALVLTCVAAMLAGCEPKPKEPKAEATVAPLQLAALAGAARQAG